MTSVEGHPEVLLANLAAGQHGVVTYRQLRQIGMGRTGIVARARDGRLHRVAPGVYAVGHPGLSQEGRWMASVFAAGPGAALTGVAAAYLHGVVRTPPKRVDVIVPRRHVPIPDATVHFTRRLPPSDVTRRKRIPVTSMARTLLEVSSRWSPYRVANLLHEAAYRRALDERQIERLLARSPGRRARSTLRRALELHRSGSAGTRSMLEERALALVEAAGLPEPWINRKIEVDRGTRIELDMYWPIQRVCLEVDGPAHARPRSQREDAARDSRLGDAGITVVRCGKRDLSAGIARVRRLLAHSRAEAV